MKIENLIEHLRARNTTFLGVSFLKRQEFQEKLMNLRQVEHLEVEPYQIAIVMETVSDKTNGTSYARKLSALEYILFLTKGREGEKKRQRQSSPIGFISLKNNNNEQ